MKPHFPFTPALALAASLALLPLASTDAAGPVEIVTTTNAWNRVRSIVSFGEPDTASYGQTFICPIQSSLLTFTVYVMPHNDPGPIDFRFYVMPWNGSRPTAPVLFHSATVSTAGRPAGFQPYEFETVGLQLTPGQAYIAFISASEVFDGISGAGSVGSVDGNTYPNGGFYYLNHGANFGRITNSNWDNISSEDLAFTAVFSELTNFPPVITVHPASRTVFENVNLDLTVSAYGSRPIAYQWHKNSLLLPDATNSILRIPQAQVSDSGDYSVTVTNLFGMALSDTGRVTVLPRPPGSRNVLISGSQMTPTLAGYIEALGHSATLVQSDAWATVSLAGYDAVWLGSESAFADLSSRIFDLYDLLDAGGIILAEVTMPGNPLTDYPFGDELSFVVNNGNFVHITAPDHPAVAGLTDGGLSNWDQSWHAYFDSIGSFTGVADTGVSGNWVLLERPFGSGQIAFTSLDISYHIQRGAGPTGPLSPKGILLNNILTLGITNRPPVIVVQPADTRAIVGFDAVLSVQAIGSAPLSFQWLREDTHLPGATSSVLTIPNAQLTDEGNFSVVVSNAAGVVTSMVAHLSVVTSSGVVGYYTDNNVFSRGAEGLITVAGFVPLQIQDISTQPLSAFSLLFLNIFDNQFVSSELLGRLPDLENWINQGGRLIVHDRSAGNIFPNPLLLGLDPGVPTIRNETPDVDVIPPGDTLVTDGPFGQITDGTLDGGSYSAHGFVPLSSLPPDAQPILSIGGQLDACVAFSYPLGRGIVYYSSIPLDCYLPDGDCVSIPVSNPLTNIYAPNVVTYASTLGSGRVLRIANVTGGEGCGQTVDVPITLNSKGDENALAFSLNYDPLLLSDPRVTLGGDAVDAALFVNDSLAASGRLGIALALTPGEAFLDNTTNEVIVVRFVVHPSTTNLVARVTFGNQPIIREVIDVLAGSLRTFFRSGNVSIVAGYEGDVAPRPTGSGHLTIADWSQLGRFAARLDALASPGEFQRADCAPRLTCGDGYLDLFDWVQAGR